MDKKHSTNEQLNHLRGLSTLLDTKFEGPMGFRFGLDGLLGLIPLVGDIVTSGMSLYIIAQAAMMGVGPSTLIRMAINVGIENLFDMIPVLGNFFDFYWKSNTRNLKLIEKHLSDPARETIKSRMVIALICCILTFVLLCSAYITYLVIRSLITWALAHSNL
jgi:hypothetical protein